MKFTLNQEVLQQKLAMYEETDSFSGVRKIAAKVRKDIGLVFGTEPKTTEKRTKLAEYMLIYGTLDHSPVLQELAESGAIDLSGIRGKSESYKMQVIDQPLPGVQQALVIAGSDKRGTIYGLFHLSELLGVSPLVDWCDVKPEKLTEYTFEEGFSYQSKVPSIRFRGFFINDEWPAFGNWCTKNFGGFNASAYDHVFELLLRLKGNYLWPAMWSARFEDDGPGLANAELADEYGVVMGMSHHEPCLRQGEEYKYLRGKDSIYGDAWNFRSNEAGITKFWEDGLKRSGKFENVITVGMRGEADTAIMGKNATLADNIELLRDVLKTQLRLIRENVNADLSKVPMMIALYKEVEEFYYGNEEAKGLMGAKELEDVILMLCDDNFGNLRTLPTEEMQKHKGGYGMYYHFDYHGSPISFEWINSSFLPKVWEQMTQAYDFGIRDLWIVNVGDICTQEFPLSYFLDLAYDFEAWGTNAINRTEEYTKLWIEKQFHGCFNAEDQVKIYELLNGYTKISSRRRPEAMAAGIYHPEHYGETKQTLAEIEHLLVMAEELYKKVDRELLPAYFALVYYPVVGTMNVAKMQLLAGRNHYLARLGAMEANHYAKLVEQCLLRDRELVKEYHTIDNGKWYGMGMSEHIGFTHWNEDECQNPVVMRVLPADKERILLMVDGTGLRAEGSGWLRNELPVPAFMEPEVQSTTFTLYSITDMESRYTITNPVPWLTCSEEGGSLNGSERASKTVTITIDRTKFPKNADRVITGYISVALPAGTCKLAVSALTLTKEQLAAEAADSMANKSSGIQTMGNTDELQKPKVTAAVPGNVFVDCKGYISIEAEHFYQKQDSQKENAGFRVIEGYGKTLSGVKVFPTTAYFTAGVDAPYLEYRFITEKAGTWQAEIYVQPSNAVTIENRLVYAVQMNDGAPEEINQIPKGEKVGDNGMFWAEGVLNNIRRQNCSFECKEGLNVLRVYAVTPGFVLEKLVLYPEKKKPAESYLGPTETCYIGC